MAFEGGFSEPFWFACAKGESTERRKERSVGRSEGGRKGEPKGESTEGREVKGGGGVEAEERERETGRERE